MADEFKTDEEQIQAHAALVRGNGRLDASESVMFARELLRVRSGLFEVKYPELEAMSFAPRNTEVSDVDEEFTFQVATQYGSTKVGSGYADTAPRADVSFTEAAPQKIKALTASYGYSFQEARISAKLGKRLPEQKARAARRAIATEVDRILSVGDTTRYGATLYGLANLPGSLSFTTSTGALGSKSWLLKTPDEILADMYNISAGIVTNSNGVIRPDSLLLPLARYEYIAQRRIGDGLGETILSHFLKTNTSIKSIKPWWRLDAAPSAEWTGMRMMAYKKDPECLEYLLPVEFEQMQPEVKGFETVIPCHARIGGFVAYQPKSYSYGDEI